MAQLKTFSKTIYDDDGAETGEIERSTFFLDAGISMISDVLKRSVPNAALTLLRCPSDTTTTSMVRASAYHSEFVIF